ncbi:hypothetical protein BD309DRAFT_480358 [Dichomitus squalens]|nr:hypothetical protein BD309DRAFT_480358 [Dichomitus squalens]
MESNRGVGRHTAYHSGSDTTGSEPNSATSLIHIREGTVNPENLSRSSTVDSFLSQSRRATTSWSSDELPAPNMPLRPLRRQQSVERGPTVQYSPEEDETVQAAVEGEHATLLRPLPPTVSSANATASGEASSAASEAHPPSVENQELREQMARLQDEIERLRRIQEMQAILEDAPPMYDPSSAPRRQS